MIASKIVLVISLTLGSVAASALAMSGDVAVEPVPAPAFEPAPGTTGRVVATSTSSTPLEAPTGTAVGQDGSAASPVELDVEPTPAVEPDHTPDDEPSARFDFTPLHSQQHGRADHNASDSFAAAPSCSHQCITKGVAYVQGNDVQIVVETNVPAQIFISVTAVIDGDERIWLDWTSFGHTSHTWLLEDLVPGVTYHVMASATDNDQHTSFVWGEFTLP